MIRQLLVFIVFLTFTLCALSQEAPRVKGSFSATDLETILLLFEQQSDHAFFYEEAWLDSLTFTGDFNDSPLDSALETLFENTLLRYFIQHQQVFITKDVKIIDRPAIALGLEKEVNQKAIEEVAKGLLFAREYSTGSTVQGFENSVFEIGSKSKMVSKGSSTIAGYVTDAETKEPVVGALVYTEDQVVSTVTDETGFYSITTSNGKNKLIFRYSGMKTTQRDVVLFSNGQLNVEMLVDVIALQEVVIESNREANVQSVIMGVERIDVEEVKNVPIVLGEKDIMKVATTFAGVQTIGEGAAGFNVRGGKSDQNLILLNNSTIYNASHFLGFFSVFNSDAIQDMQVYKSGVPAVYGGRLSSVFDIESKKSDIEKFTGTGGISLVTGKLVLEIPIVKEKSGLMIGGRTTYSNWLLQRTSNANFKENRIFFGDVIMRYDHAINEKNDLEISGYISKDKFRLSSDTVFSFSDFSYVNKNASASWKHRFNDNFDAEIRGVYSSYGYELSNDLSAPNSFTQGFDIKEFTATGQLNYYLSEKHIFTLGTDIKQYQINPGNQSPLGAESLISETRVGTEQAREAAIYLSDEFTVSSKLSFYGGLRYSTYSFLGPNTVISYQANAPKNSDTQTGSQSFTKGEVINTYHGPEARVNARFVINDFSSIKASYNKTRQYIHTLSNSASLSPTDIWRLSTPYVKPQIADQLALGYFRNFSDNKIETSVEVYYKKLQNLIDVKVGSEFLLNEHVETVGLQGPGKAYGLEVSLKKTGKLNGWLNYSFARTFIKLDGDYPEETINQGAYYSANYDMPHTVNMVANYKLTKRWSFSYNFSFRSGRPITFPVGAYNFKGFQAAYYADRNSYRIPNYVRMDLGINLEAGHKIARLAHSYWTLSVYNLLGRDNPFSVFFDTQGGEIKGYQLVVFGNPLPTITYNFKF